MTTLSWQHRGTASERGYGARWRKLRDFILRRDCGLCLVCTSKGRLTLANEVDHITPKAKGGTDDPENLRSICQSCHRDKSAVDRGHRVRQTVGPDGWPTAEG